LTVPLPSLPVSGFFTWYTPALANGVNVNPVTGSLSTTAGAYGSAVPTNLAQNGGMNGPFSALNDPNGNAGNILTGDWKDFITGTLSYNNSASYGGAPPVVFADGCTNCAWNNPVFWSYYNAAYAANAAYVVTATLPVVNNGYQYDFSTDSVPLSPLGPTNYVGNSGMAYFDADPSNPSNTRFSNGPFYKDSRVRVIDITDGSSNTIMFGESLGGADNALPTYILTWMGTGTMPSYWDCQTPSQYFMFSSHHAAVVNFAFCDGSVRTITKVQAPSTPDTFFNPPAAANPASPMNARWAAFQQMAGINDNSTPNQNLLGMAP
jgi:Protein of unknown function (DUF1559)